MNTTTRKLMCQLACLWLVCGVAVGGADDRVAVGAVKEDIIPPVIDHPPFDQPVVAGTAIRINAIVEDSQSGVREVVFYYRNLGAMTYTMITMTSAGSDVYCALIPAEQVRQPAVEYFIEAVDRAGNTMLRGIQFSPLVIAVTGEAMPPDEWAEDFAGVVAPFPAKERRRWQWWQRAVFAVGVSLAYCYSSCNCAKDCDDDRGTVSVDVPNP